MASAVITTKGQVTIPVEIRNQLGLKAGDRIDFEPDPQTGEVKIRRKTGTLAELRGMLKYVGPPATIEEMNEAVGRYLGEDDERIKRQWREGV